MIWLIVIIVVVAFVLFSKLHHSPKEQPPPPPSKDVELFGCSGIVECGYWSPETIVHDDGSIELNRHICYCSYQHKKVKEGSPCLFEKEHPELIRDGFILSGFEKNDSYKTSN